MDTEYEVNSRPRRAPTHPGTILKEDVLPHLDISVSEAARELGLTRQTLHRIMAGTTSITPEVALRLGRFCGNGPAIWLRMQQNYDLWHAEKKLAKTIAKIPCHSMSP